MKDAAQPITLLLYLVIILLLGLIAWRQIDGGPPLDTSKPVAVLLTGGAAYYGRAQDGDADFLVLTDVHYVRQVQNPETKEVTSVLVKRGQEVHGPDRMVIPIASIQFIENVSADSEIGSKMTAAGG